MVFRTVVVNWKPATRNWKLPSAPVRESVPEPSILPLLSRGPPWRRRRWRACGRDWPRWSEDRARAPAHIDRRQIFWPSRDRDWRCRCPAQSVAAFRQEAGRVLGVSGEVHHAFGILIAIVSDRVPARSPSGARHDDGAQGNLPIGLLPARDVLHRNLVIGIALALALTSSTTSGPINRPAGI